MYHQSSWNTFKANTISNFNGGWAVQGKGDSSVVKLSVYFYQMMQDAIEKQNFLNNSPKQILCAYIFWPINEHDHNLG